MSALYTESELRKHQLTMLDFLLKHRRAAWWAEPGTGKTQLVKGLAAGLGIPGTVTSPTFALLQEHNDGTLPLAHIDLYRLESQQEIVGAGLEHYLTTPDGVTAVEWFERWLGGDWQLGQALPESARPGVAPVLRLVIFSEEGETKRKITYEDFGH